jgi:hypothetical protein
MLSTDQAQLKLSMAELSQMKPIRASAQVDDIQLERQAREYVAELGGHLASREYLYSISNEHGTDLAATVFYHSIFAIPKYDRFIKAIDRQKIAETPYKTGIKLFIVPAFFIRNILHLEGVGSIFSTLLMSWGLMLKW